MKLRRHAAFTVNHSHNLIAIVGPTASGKTSLAVELAQRLDGEIVGADSRQVYRHMDIGTAKPSPEEQAAARHHLIDVVDPDQPFSLADWLELAQRAIENIWSRDKQPLLVGGSGQYVWALLEGWRVPRVPAQPALREQLLSRAAGELLKQLRQLDPDAEEFIDPRNVRRVVRAIEVSQATGRPFSFWRTKKPPRFHSQIIGLPLPREELYRRIDERVDRMFEAGLVEEVKRLLELGYGRDLPAMSGIGYKEIGEYLAGECDLQSAVARMKTGTHRLARHQNAWFKRPDNRIEWFDTGPGLVDDALAVVARECPRDRCRE